MNFSDERTWIRIFWITEGDDRYAAFVIDGREYPDSESVLNAVREAADELDRRRIPGDIETRLLTETQPPSPLPTWEEYRERLMSGDVDR